MIDYLIILIVVAGSFYLISQPLLNARRVTHGPSDDVAALRAARDTKFQELRDAEMDLRTGKLSDDDYQAIDQTLRTEAAEILHRLDAADAADARDWPDSGDDRLPSSPR